MKNWTIWTYNQFKKNISIGVRILHGPPNLAISWSRFKRIVRWFIMKVWLQLYHSFFSFLPGELQFVHSCFVFKGVAHVKTELEDGRWPWWLMIHDRFTNQQAENKSSYDDTCMTLGSEALSSVSSDDKGKHTKAMGYILLQRQGRQCTVSEVMDLEPRP